MPKKAKWNELPCPQCKEPMAVDALRCPHCQHQLSSEEIAERKKQNKNTMIGCGALALMAVLALGLCSGGDQPEEAAIEALPPPPKEGTAPVNIQKLFDEFASRITAATAKCDAATKRIAEDASGIGNGTTSVFEAYQEASFASEACSQNMNEISRIAVPDGFDQASAKLAKQTIEACADAMFAKKLASDTWMEILDGDQRPSKVQEFSEQSNASQGAVMLCGGSLASTAMQAGAELNLEP